MTDREESEQPRKRIAVACGRCRKRKIRCSGDPGNGGPCSNCKNAGHEPCLFLRVSSQETPFIKDGGDYTYNLDAARPYAHQTRGPVSPLGSLPQYTHDIAGGDAVAPYRQGAYPYSSKGYYPAIPGWTSAYTDDGSVDYSLNYSPYQMVSSEPASLVPAYSQYGGRKSVYVDPEASSYSYSNLVHRAAVNNDTQGFSLSSMAASLPSTSDRILSSDRLHSSVNRTLTSSSNYRADGLTAHYSNSSGNNGNNTGSGSTKAPPANSMSDVAYSNLHPSFESPYTTTGSIASSMAPSMARQQQQTGSLSGHAAETSAYAAGPTTAADQLYANSGDQQTIRAATEDVASGGLSYVYSDAKLDESRREPHSHSGGGGGSTAGATTATGSLLSNGHVYVPNSHSHPPHASSHSYIIPSNTSGAQVQARGNMGGSASSLGAGAVDASRGSIAVTGRGSGSGSGNGSGNGNGGGTGNVRSVRSSHGPSDSHRRSAGSLRGG